jgi:heat shock protein 5
MVKEAEEYAEEDNKEKAKIQAKNDLEAYLYNLKNSINEALEGKLSEDDKSSLTNAVNDGLDWLEDHPAAEKEEYDEKQKEVEQIANPIIKKAYESANEAAGAGGDDDDFMGEDLDGVNDGPSVEETE